MSGTKYISWICCLRASLVTSCLVSVKRILGCVITHRDTWHWGCVCPCAGDQRHLEEMRVNQGPGNPQAASLLCWAAESLLAVSWVRALSHSLIIPASAGRRWTQPSPALWPGGGNDLMPCRWILGTRGLVTPIPSPLPSSYFSPHGSIMGHWTCAQKLSEGKWASDSTQINNVCVCVCVCVCVSFRKHLLNDLFVLYTLITTMVQNT